MYAHVGATSPMQTVPKQTLNLLEKDTVIPNDTKQWLQSSLNWEYMHSIWIDQYNDKASEQVHVLQQQSIQSFWDFQVKQSSSTPEQSLIF